MKSNFSWKKKTAIFIGRFQPYHQGHISLIMQNINQGIPALIMVRDIAPDIKNPFTTDQTINMIQQVYGNTKQVQLIRIPDIESVNYGRGVGYEINEHVPPQNVGFISATNIRSQIVENSDAWKENVDPSIHGLVRKHLMESA